MGRKSDVLTEAALHGEHLLPRVARHLPEAVGQFLEHELLEKVARRKRLRQTAHDDLDAYRAQQAGETVVDKEGRPVGPIEKPDARALELDHARALGRAIETHERFNKLLVMTVGRRSEVLGSIERYRIGLGQWLREATDAAAPDASAQEHRQIAAVPLVPSDGPAQ